MTSPLPHPGTLNKENLFIFLENSVFLNNEVLMYVIIFLHELESYVSSQPMRHPVHFYHKIEKSNSSLTHRLPGTSDVCVIKIPKQAFLLTEECLFFSLFVCLFSLFFFSPDFSAHRIRGDSPLEGNQEKCTFAYIQELSLCLEQGGNQ